MLAVWSADRSKLDELLIWLHRLPIVGKIFGLRLPAMMLCFDAVTGEELGNIPERGPRERLSPNGKFYAVGIIETGAIAVWDVPPSKPVGLFVLLALAIIGVMLGGFRLLAIRRKKSASVSAPSTPSSQIAPEVG